MSNSQRYFSYQHGNGQPLDNGPYNSAQMTAARKSLFQQVGYGRLQWLISRMQFNSYSHGNRMMTSNLWEGDEGMMEHIQQPFPMPPCSSFSQENLNSEQHVKDSPIWVNSDSDEDQLHEKLTEDYSEMSNSRDLEESFKGEESSGAVKSPLRFGESFADNNITGNHLSKKEQKLTLLKRITKINDDLNRLQWMIPMVLKQLCNPYSNMWKRACQKLANIHSSSVSSRAKLKMAQQEFETRRYNTSKSLTSGVRRMQDSESSSLSSAVKNCNTLRSRIKDILHKKAKIIEPYRTILNDAIKDILGGSREGDEPLPRRIKENKDEDSTLQLAKSSPTNVKQLAEPSLARGNKRCSDKSRTLINGRDISLTSHASENVGVISESTKNSLRIDKTEGDYVGGIGRPSSEVPGCDKSLLASHAEATTSSEKCEDKVDYSDADTFWNNLTELRKEICSVIIDLNNIIKMPSVTPKLKKKKKLLKDKCDQLVSMHKGINSFKVKLRKLKKEMNMNNYTERGPFGLDDLKRWQIMNCQSNCSSLQVVEALLNYLTSAYMRVRNKSTPSLQKWGFITDPGDLSFNVGVESTSLMHIFAHLETCINAATTFKSSDKPDPGLDPQKATSSCDQGTPTAGNNIVGYS